MTILAEPFRIALAAGTDATIGAEVLVDDGDGTTVPIHVPYNVADGSRRLRSAKGSRMLGFRSNVSDKLSTCDTLLDPELRVKPT